MIYHLFQNSVWKVVKIAKMSNLKYAVKSQTITTVDLCDFFIEVNPSFKVERSGSNNFKINIFSNNPYRLF